MKVFHADASVTGCSFNGAQFERAEDGSFEVPDDAAAELISHGFSTRQPLLGDVKKGAVAPEEHQRVVGELGAAAASLGELSQRYDALAADRNALAAQVKDLQAQLEAALEGAKGKKK